MVLKRVIAEPMVHFLLLGLALFGVYHWRAPADASHKRIVITQGVVDDLVRQHVAARGREPRADELRHLMDAYVRDEILYREGVSLGLDRDDIVIKRRVRQKIEVMQEEEATSEPPTDAELSAYLATHPDRFARPPVITFEQVFLGSGAPPRNGDGTPGPERVVLVRDGAPQGQLLPARMTRTPADLIARRFGDAFAAALQTVPIGEWVGPVGSTFGGHEVRVVERTPRAMPALGDIRDEVVREWENDRRQQARSTRYSIMRPEYHVIVEAKVE